VTNRTTENTPAATLVASGLAKVSKIFLEVIDREFVACNPRSNQSSRPKPALARQLFCTRAMLLARAPVASSGARNGVERWWAIETDAEFPHNNRQRLCKPREAFAWPI
jgi:hypothetical protein